MALRAVPRPARIVTCGILGWRGVHGWAIVDKHKGGMRNGATLVSRCRRRSGQSNFVTVGAQQPKRRNITKLERKQLELEAFRAVSGGDYVRSRVLHGLALGDPNVERAAYLIKSRVKRVDSLLLKVMNRRRSKNKNYRPADASDIVGFRLLTLFRNELPLLVRRFLDFVETSQRGGLGIFVGKSLRDTIQEIRIYGSSLRDDSNMELCVRELTDFGFTVVTGSPKREDIQIEFDYKESQYSSIHIVLMAEGPVGQGRPVPVEVQLRTSLEDVWGEIDHRIVYKEKTISALSNDGSDREAELESIHNRVKTLKNMLDSCSNTADIIDSDLNRPPPFTSTSNYVDQVSVSLDRLLELPVAESIQRRLARAAQILADFAGRIAEISTRNPPVETLLLPVGTATQELEKALADYLAGKPRASKTDHTIRFRIGMEIALCYYWQAILLSAQEKMEGVPGVMENSRDAIRRSISTYLALGTLREFANSSTLAFRLANAIAFQGNEEYAQSHHERAYRYLSDDSDLEPDNYMRVRIPREYGVALWKCAHRLECKSIELGDRSISWEQEREYCLRALDVTLPVHGLEITGGSFDRATINTQQESIITANNIVYYAVSYLEAGGSWEELLEHGLSRETLSKYVTEVIPTGLRRVTRMIFADTIRLAAKHLGDDSLNQAAARKVLSLSGNIDLRVPYSDLVYKKMLREAREDLARASAR